MISANDIKLFAYLYCANSEKLSEDEKIYLADFIDEGSVEDVMNLLITGTPKTLTEANQKNIKESFLSSYAGKLIIDLNKEAERFTAVEESFFPSKAELTALSYMFQYIKSPVGIAHSKASIAIANKISSLLGDSIKLGGLEFTKPLPSAISRYNTILAGSFATIGAVGAGLIVAAVSYLAYTVYKNYFDKFQKKCKKERGKARKACIAAARLNAFEAQIQALKAKKGLCSKSKDPKKCSSKLEKKISKMESKLKEAKAKYTKAMSLAKSLASKAKLGQ